MFNRTIVGTNIPPASILAALLGIGIASLIIGLIAWYTKYMMSRRYSLDPNEFDE